MPKVVPANFPPLLGTLSLALIWRGQGVALIDWVVVAAVLVFVGLYLARVAGDWTILARDLETLPGRTGLAAMNLALMLAAIPVARAVPALGMALVLATLVAQGGLVLAVTRRLMLAPPPGRMLQPAWQMIYVGMIVAVQALVLVGFVPLAKAIVALSLVVAIVIWAGALVLLLTKRAPPPGLRPALAIHLSPAAMIGLGAFASQGPGLLVQMMFWLGLAIFLALVLALRWLTVAGYSPQFSAFTFPLTAFTALSLTQSQWLGFGLLAASTLIVPYLLGRVLILWARGELAAKTMAAE